MYDPSPKVNRKMFYAHQRLLAAAGSHNRLRAWPHQRRCDAQRDRSRGFHGSLAACAHPDDTYGLDQEGVGRRCAVSGIIESPPQVDRDHRSIIVVVQRQRHPSAPPQTKH